MNRTIDFYPGQLWIYATSFSIKKDDIIVKILKVTDDRVFCIRKTHYGYTDLSPQSYKKSFFLDHFLFLCEL